MTLFKKKDDVADKAFDNQVTSTYQLFRQLSGLTVNAYATKIGVSHTYWRQLETGVMKNPSQRIKNNISSISGVSVEAVEYLLKQDHPGSMKIYKRLIETLENCAKESGMDAIAKDRNF